MGNSAVHPPAFNGRWTTGLCGCFEDCSICCCGYCCPCVLVGRTVEIIDRGANSCCLGGCVFCLLEYCTGCGCFYTFSYRARLRQKFELPEEPCGDLCVECFCLSCSICQVYRELKYRGINPLLGWQGVQAIYDSPGQPPQPMYQEEQLKLGPPIFDEPPAAAAAATAYHAPPAQHFLPAAAYHASAAEHFVPAATAPQGEGSFGHSQPPPRAYAPPGHQFMVMGQHAPQQPPPY